MATRIDTTHLGASVAPERGPVVGRTVLVMLGALLVAGLVGGLMPLVLPGGTRVDEPAATAKEYVVAMGLGLLVGLAAFFLALVPVIITAAVTKDFMARGNGRARLVAFLLWLGLSLITLVIMWQSLGSDFKVALYMVAPSMALVLVAVVLLAPWMVWRRFRGR